MRQGLLSAVQGPAVARAAAVALVAAGLVVGCGGSASERVAVPARNGAPTPERPATEPPRVEPGPWLVVEAEECRRLADRPIYHQGPRQPPALLGSRHLALPIPASAVPDRPVLVQVVVSDTGRVAKVRLLRAPPIAGLEPEVLDARLIATLGELRFEPARLDGEAVAVYYDLTLVVDSER